jgi:hypothetical protein
MSLDQHSVLVPLTKKVIFFRVVDSGYINKMSLVNSFTETISLTFSSSVENHKGMEIITSKDADGSGFSYGLCTQLAQKFQAERIVLNDLLPDEYKSKSEEACVVIFRNGVKQILGLNPDDLLAEQKKLIWDSKMLNKGKVMNKNARHNLCFADFEQQADFAVGKGTVYNFADDSCAYLRQARAAIGEQFGFNHLLAEGNRYYDAKKCYIGFHGDTERAQVFCLRLGATFPIYYQWYHKFAPVGALGKIDLNHGDIYIMSEKAVGCDWRKSSLLTLRHAAGDQKVIMPLATKALTKSQSK